MGVEERTLIHVLRNEQEYKIKGGIYNKIQVDFAYNSNHIEGSRLTHEQTRYIFETHAVGAEPVRVDDIIEAVNHFRCFDLILKSLEQPLDEPLIKLLHKTLKLGTLSSESPEAVVGGYKKYSNIVAGMETVPPEQVEGEMRRLLEAYARIESPDMDDILDFHAAYEKIHPFYDGNGRTGRLIMFRECLRCGIVPFIIADEYKAYYYRGLKEWQSGREKGYLRDTCLLMQDNMKKVLDYFEISYGGATVANRQKVKKTESQRAPKL